MQKRLIVDESGALWKRGAVSLPLSLVFAHYLAMSVVENKRIIERFHQLEQSSDSLYFALSIGAICLRKQGRKSRVSTIAFPLLFVVYPTGRKRVRRKLLLFHARAHAVESWQIRRGFPEPGYCRSQPAGKWLKPGYILVTPIILLPSYFLGRCRMERKGVHFVREQWDKGTVVSKNHKTSMKVNRS